MAFSLGSLQAYTREQIEPLLTAAVLGAKTQQLILQNGVVLTEVKSSAKIPLFSTDVVLQTQSCSFDPSGTTTITQREVTVGKIKVEEQICPKDLEAFFTQQALRAGSTYEDFGNADFQAKYLADKNAKIAAANEVAIWQGNTASGNANLNKFDGLIKLIAAGSPISANTGALSGTPAITTSNVISIIQAVKNKIPAALKGMTDVVVMVGYDVYDMYVDAGVAANLFHYNYNDNSNYGGLTIPGTGIKLEAVHGLDGTGDIFAMRVSNMVIGVDLANEEENYDMWYSQDDRVVKFSTQWKLGVNVAFTSEVVQFLGTIS
jgi:hypothetical protein